MYRKQLGNRWKSELIAIPNVQMQFDGMTGSNRVLIGTERLVLSFRREEYRLLAGF